MTAFRSCFAGAYTYVLALAFSPVGQIIAGDWPQILGPNRNGVAVDEPPIQPWPPAGPKGIWTVAIGSGFAGPVIVGDRTVIFHRIGDAERIECLDMATGKGHWQADFPATYAPGVNPDNGPRCVPLVHKDRVFVFGAAGTLHCVMLADGKKAWSRDPYADYEGQEGYFGAGSTPIVVSDKLLVNVGGRDAGLVAFDLTNGKTLWKATSEGASYSSPTSATVNGKLCAIFVTRMKCLAIDPANGAVVFQFPFGRSGPTVNGAAPLVIGDQLFVSASYNVGARLSSLAKPTSAIWSNDESMSSQYTTCVFREGFLYGIHGREDHRDGELRCIELATGKVRWTVPGFGTGHLTLVNDQLLILTTEGELVLSRAQPEKHTELARSRVSSGVTRSLPAFSRGRFIFRDNDQVKGRLSCLDLTTGRAK
jgi:outer membrane protein assembly factor BamB